MQLGLFAGRRHKVGHAQRDFLQHRHRVWHLLLQTQRLCFCQAGVQIIGMHVQGSFGMAEGLFQFRFVGQLVVILPILPQNDPGQQR